ncbi:NUDIX domain-containing protein [Jeotgalibaca arthritidis]|uniref:NUDIX domain-containing protein n=1 Tax=Jeotgalibaca arthritidis TaxID=1868794 RepID=UPI0035A08313
MYHRAMGVYGVIHNQKELLVINKNGGPYTNRYDLCGGSLEEGELLEEAVIREVKEETGLDATIKRQLGSVSYRYPWKYEHYTDNVHIAIFYEMTASDLSVLGKISEFDGQDSVGCAFVPIDKLTSSNSSPLVMSAKQYLESHSFSTESQNFEEWEVLTVAQY